MYAVPSPKESNHPSEKDLPLSIASLSTDTDHSDLNSTAETISFFSKHSKKYKHGITLTVPWQFCTYGVVSLIGM